MKTSSKILSTGVIVVAVGFLVFWYQGKEKLLASEKTNIETKQLSDKVKTPEEKPVTAAKTNYKNGTYSIVTDYMSPAGKENIGIDVNIQNDKIASVTVKNMAENKVSANYQNIFIAGIQSVIIGQELNSLKVDVVSGASLTTNAFNAALVKIKAQAQL